MASTIAKTPTGIGRQAAIWTDDENFMVRLHATTVYKEIADTIELNNGGWITPSTVRYMNQALIHRGFHVHVFIKKGQMFWQAPSGNPQPFVNGVAIIHKSGVAY